jgi:hypothetical protein
MAWSVVWLAAAILLGGGGRACAQQDKGIEVANSAGTAPAIAGASEEVALPDAPQPLPTQTAAVETSTMPMQQAGAGNTSAGSGQNTQQSAGQSGGQSAQSAGQTTGKAEQDNASAPAPGYGQQPKRILGVMPNYRAVSVGAKVPPPTMKQKFKVATLNSFDYSAFIFNAINVEVPYIERSYPEFGNGMVAYGRYYWRGFLDKTDGNYMTDAIVPTLTRQDARYYTLGRGHWYVRALYAYTRVLITPNDNGRNTFNFSEIVGKGAAAGIGNLYYPSSSGGWTKTGQRWLVQVAVRDGGFNIFREFWPDIAVHILHRKPGS